MEEREYELIRYLLKVVMYGLVLIGVLWGITDPASLVGLV